ncbi:hypothetical protein [Thalassotalea atypica]|uniref:hypothetical protein n=1 Tax=Thalassotalea atypica TaxID=2054316 RepID=UPI002572E4DA|nr:hypothetical protein [Thalassotalea atypica]
MIRYVLIVISIVLGLYIFQFGQYGLSSEQDVWGAFGDYIGGILNPIIASLALIYLIKTYATQKEELTETKKALTSSAESHQEQTEQQTLANILQKKANELEERNQRINLLQAEISCIDATLQAALNGQNSLLNQLNENSKKIEGINEGDSPNLTPESKRHLIERSQKLRNYLGESDKVTIKLQDDLKLVREKIKEMINLN